MRIDIVTALPGIVSGPLEHSIIQRAIKAELVEINVFIHPHQVRAQATLPATIFPKAQKNNGGFRCD